MEIFLDTANLEDIRRYAFLLDGVTTNPTLLALEDSRGDWKRVVRTIAEMVKGPVSVEAVGETAGELVAHAEELTSLSPRVVVKIPMTEEGLRATRALSGRGISTNVTLLFSANQAILAAKAGATYASIFVGRLDDIGHDGIAVVKEAVDIYRIQGYSTRLITASVRHPLHVTAAARAGTHAITIPPTVLALMGSHSLTDIGIARFTKDWKRLVG